MQKIITVNNGVARNPAWRLAAPVNLCIGAGEHVAIVGPNGSGKTLLVNALTGRYPLLGDAIIYDFGPSSSPLASDNIRYIAFRDSYGEADGSYYYQQRWNSQDADTTPLVRDCLPTADKADAALRESLFALFGMKAFMKGLTAGAIKI